MAAKTRHQSAKEVIMVRPASFGFDEDTMADNAFQKVVPEDGDAKKVHEKALEEFDEVVQLLKRNGVTVITFNDNPIPAKPDAIFPNNWFSTNSNGSLFIYPMMAPSRRTEQRMDIVKYLEDIYHVEKVINWKELENEGVFLEGTGSVVFDHIFKKAYACISSRTNAKLVGQMCSHLSYEPILFEAFDDKHGKPIYHTNVLMWIGTTVAAICADAIPDAKLRENVCRQLRLTGREIVLLSFQEMEGFAGNCLELRTRHDELILAISKTAVNSLTSLNLAALQRHLRFLEVNVGTIEAIGGGGIRCMLAEVLYEKKNDA